MTSLQEAPVKQPAEVAQTITLWFAVVFVVILLSGGLFGYEQDVLSGALHGIILGGVMYFKPAWG